MTLALSEFTRKENPGLILICDSLENHISENKGSGL
jgi:hypothetical protein